MQKAITKDRAQTYETLANIYLKEPEPQFMESINAFLNISGKRDIDSLKQEYYDRFFVTISGIYVPPFESVILEDTLNGEITTHVLDCYKLVNFNPWELDIFEPLKGIYVADFLGFEICFMSYLAYCELNEKNKTLKTKWLSLQKDFLEKHLSTWTKKYAKRVNKTKKGFYNDLINLTAEIVEEDLHFIS